MQVRDAADSDLAGILEIYNDIIRTSTAVYSVEPVTIDERRAWLATRRERGFPVLVAIDAMDATQVLGFASFGEWRGSWNGYRYTVEHTVHVRADARRRGVGRELV